MRLEGDENDRIILHDSFELHDNDNDRRQLEHYLKGASLKDFQQAWEIYAQHCERRTNVSIYEYIGSEILDMEKAHDPNHLREVAESRRQQALKLIRKLLEFATRK